MENHPVVKASSELQFSTQLQNNRVASLAERRGGHFVRRPRPTEFSEISIEEALLLVEMKDAEVVMSDLPGVPFVHHCVATQEGYFEVLMYEERAFFKRSR